MKPNNVKILGKTFRIIYPKKIDKDNSYGECDGANRTIKIRADLEGAIYRETVLHEILHAIFYMTGHSELISPEQEESLVLSLENGLSELVDLRIFAESQDK